MILKKEVFQIVLTKITALYERLSRDDDQQGESNSIINQKKYLEDYARTHGFGNIMHFTDDGYTGTNFNRPGFNALLEEVRANRVAVIIVKDMSRLGRNYLQVGFYTEMLFPEKGVRFIAINNSIDSNNPTENEFTPFLNIMNEWYARDTSKKIKAVFRNRMENGKRCSGAIPYGYRREPGDKQTLHVDEEAATVVRRIFKMAAEGTTVSRISEILSEERVLIPSAYLEAHGMVSRKHNLRDPYFWTITTIAGILERREYLGHTVLGKTVSENFKTKKRRKARADELLFFPNTHEAIVDQETWDMANKMRKRCPKRVANGTYTQRLSGLVFCADCGARMGYSSPPTERIEAGTVRDSDHSYQCGNYRNHYHSCTSHFIKVSDLETAILRAVQAVTKHVLEDEEKFATELMAQWQEAQKQTDETTKRDLTAAKQRHAELDRLIQGLYENQIRLGMPERQIQRLMAQYDDEQVQIEKQITELESIDSDTKHDKGDIARFIGLIRKYKNMEEVTDAMLYALIERIEVHAPLYPVEKSALRIQQVDIHFNCIGRYVAPEMAHSYDECLAAIKAKVQRQQMPMTDRRKLTYGERLAILKERAKVDPDAAAKYESMLQSRRKSWQRYSEKKKAQRDSDPTVIEKRELAAHKAKLNKMRISELQSLSETDSMAAEVLKAKREKTKAKNAAVKARRKVRMQVDPAYAAEQQAKKVELDEKRRNQYQALKEAASTDPEAAAKLTLIRKRASEATMRNYWRKKRGDATKSIG